MADDYLNQHDLDPEEAATAEERATEDAAHDENQKKLFSTRCASRTVRAGKTCTSTPVPLRENENSPRSLDHGSTD